MSWILRAEGGSPDVDRIEVRRALEVLIKPGEYHEIRGLPSGRSRIISGDNLDAAVERVVELSDDKGVYYTLNPVRATLGDHAAREADIVSRRWLLIDVDRKKLEAPEESATAEEKDRALTLMGTVHDWLAEQGWPMPVIVDSGNGGHLLYQLDLPADNLVKVAMNKALKMLASRWQSPHATIDSVVHNHARISKLPGTWARKGTNSEARPHRLARLLWVPDDLRPVTIEQIQALHSEPTKPSEHFNPWVIKTSGSGNKREAYGRSALEREIGRVVLSSVGSRNDTLNAAAFNLGTLVGAHVLQRSEAAQQLMMAAQQTGLGELEIRRTVDSGLEAGRKKPRILPPELMDAERNGTPPEGTRLIIWAKDIKPRKVNWLWPQRLPLGKMVTFAGQTGMGKTFTVCDIAARVTAGKEIPFGKGECFQQGKVLMISAEDDADDTIVPRFMEMGGDLNRLAFLSPDAEEHFSLAALDLLKNALDQIGSDVRLVVIDPPTSYVGRTDDHKNAELRGLLAPLKRWTRDRGVVLIFVTHVNKPTGQKVEAIGRVIGSVAWVAAVRAAHMFCQDPDDQERRIFAPLKINNAAKPRGLSYNIKTTSADLAVIEWIEEVDTTADQAMSGQKRAPKSVTAAEWLIATFRDQREWTSTQFWASAKEHCISKNAIDEARERLLMPKPRKSTTPEGGVCWTWWVPDDWPYLTIELARDEKQTGDLKVEL